MRSGALIKLLTRTVCCLLVFAFAGTTLVKSQASEDASAGTTVTTIEGPNGAGLVVGDGTAWFVTRDQITKVDAATNRLNALPIERMWIFSVAAGDGSLWVVGKVDDRLGIYRLDPQSGKTLDSIPLQKSQMGLLSYRYGALWIWSMPLHYRPLLRVDPASKQILPIDLGKGSGGDPAFSDGKVWIVGTESGMAQCVDAQTGKVLDQFSIGGKHNNGALKGSFKAGLYTFAVGDGILWVGNSMGLYGGRYVLSAFDIKTHERVAELEIDGSHGQPVLWNGSVWLSTSGDPQGDHYVTRIDAKLRTVAGRMLLPSASRSGQSSGSWGSVLMSDGDSLWALSPGLWSGKEPSIVRRIQVKPELEK